MLGGCAGGDDTTPTSDTEPVSGCADPVPFDALVEGDVSDDGAAAAGVTVRLEERNWEPGTVHGEGVTDASGRYSFTATGMPIIEGCWGWATGFYVVADDGSRTAEWGVNSVVTGAWSRGDATIDLTGIPLDLAD